MDNRNINRPPRGDEFRKNFAIHQIGLVKAQDTPDLSVRINPMMFPTYGNNWVQYSGGNSQPMTPPEPTYAKWVIVTINGVGGIQLIDGTQAANNPLFPTIPEENLPLAAVFIQGDDTEVTNDMVYDIRPFLQVGTNLPRHKQVKETDLDDLHPINSITGLSDALNDRITMEQFLNALLNKANVTGTTSEKFTLNEDETGVPASTVTIAVDRGDQPEVGIRWNEQTEIWEFTTDGTEWIPFSNAGFIGKASNTVWGISKLSVAADDEDNPIVVGINDPILTSPKTPLAHAGTHAGGGTDVLALAVANGASGALSGADKQKLNDITDDRLFADLIEKSSVLNHLTNTSDPHNSIGQHLIAIDHDQIFKNILTPYVVGKETTDAYSTIQNAIDAIVTNGDNDAGKVATIFVKPGNYAENLTLQPNIIITTLSGNKELDVIISGTVTMGFSVAGNFAGLKGLIFTNVDNDTFKFEGSNKQRLDVENCEFIVSTPTHRAFSISNSSVLSEINAVGCTFKSNGTHAADIFANNGSVTFKGQLCLFKALSANTLRSIRTSSNGKTILDSSEIYSGIICEGASQLQIYHSRVSPLDKSISMNSTEKCIFGGIMLDSINLYAIDGTGKFYYNHIVYMNTTVEMSSTLNSSTGPIELPSTNNILYTPANAGNWIAPPPTTIKEAIDKIANALATHLGYGI